MKQDEVSSGKQLTKRELYLLELMSEGHPDKEIAIIMMCSTTAIKRLATSVFIKLGARNRANAVLIACNKGIITLAPDYSI